jgi:hypothetical protein
MANTPTLLVSGFALGNTLSSVYTVPEGKIALLSAFTLNNMGGRGCDVTIHLTPPGYSPAQSNQVATRLRVPAGVDPVQVPALVAQAMPAGASLWMLADRPGCVVPLVSGYLSDAE